MKPGFAMFWNCVATPEMGPVLFLSPSAEMLMMLSFHDGHGTSRSFGTVSKIAAAVCLFYTGTARRCTLTMPSLFRCICVRMSRYNVLMCADMSKATKKIHVSSSRSYNFCRLIAQEIRA